MDKVIIARKSLTTLNIHSSIVSKRQDERNMLIKKIGEITPDTIVDGMLESETKWSAVRRFVECVLRRRRVHLDTIRRNDLGEDEPVA